MTAIQAPAMSTRPAYTTYCEAVERLLDQANQLQNDGSVDARPLRVAKRAVRYANDNLASYHDHWKLYRGVARVTVPAAYTSGTVVIDASTGTATLSGGVWPAWAWYGELLVGGDRELVASRVSDTVLSLENATKDYEGSYSLLCSVVPINNLVRKLDSVFDAESGVALQPTTFDNISRYAASTPGTSLYPSIVTLSGDARLHGSIGLHVQPPSTSRRVLEFAYHRRPRPLRTYKVEGTLSVSGTTATFDDSVLADKHVGSIVEVGDEQRVIASVTSATVAELDAAWTVSAGSDYVLSDPLDALPGAMTEAMVRLAEKETSRSLTQEKAGFRGSGFTEALKLAMAEDAAMTTPVSAVPWFHWGGLTLGEVDVV